MKQPFQGKKQEDFSTRELQQLLRAMRLLRALLQEETPPHSIRIATVFSQPDFSNRLN